MMSERYWITGVQLGLLQVYKEEKHRKMLVEEIIDKQFIGNYKTEKAKMKYRLEKYGKKKVNK
jgi:hypothetical protein